MLSLCEKAILPRYIPCLLYTSQPDPASDSRPAAMEKLVHELISDRLLTLSRYITLDSSTRTILIDQTSLSADGYQVVTH